MVVKLWENCVFDSILLVFKENFIFKNIVDVEYLVYKFKFEVVDF